jgi:DNA-binding transcriptional MerR regulator
MYKAASESLKTYLPFPDKLFYKIGEVSKIVGVEPYVLRYWETEFNFLKPRKNKSGQRVYIKKDVELLLAIKRLLYQERYTIEGVRKRLGFSSGNSDLKPEQDVQQDVQKRDSRQPVRAIEHVKKRLRDILSQLQS